MDFTQVKKSLNVQRADVVLLVYKCNLKPAVLFENKLEEMKKKAMEMMECEIRSVYVSNACDEHVF